MVKAHTAWNARTEIITFKITCTYQYLSSLFYMCFLVTQSITLYSSINCRFLIKEILGTIYRAVDTTQFLSFRIRNVLKKIPVNFVSLRISKRMIFANCVQSATLVVNGKKVQEIYYTTSMKTSCDDICQRQILHESQIRLCNNVFFYMLIIIKYWITLINAYCRNSIPPTVTLKDPKLKRERRVQKCSFAF